MKYLSLIITSFFIFFLIGMKYENETHQGEMITIHTPGDIIYADLFNLQVCFEVSNDIHRFTDRHQLFEFLEKQSADQAQGMKEYQIELDFDTVRVYQFSRYVDCYIVQEPLSPLDEILSLDNR